MYLMYVDESGDTGFNRSPTAFFALSGIVIHESRWREFLNLLISFRKAMRSVYGLPVRAEIHATEFINGRVRAVGGSLIARQDKLAVLRNALDEMTKINYISITNVIVDKRDKETRTPVYDVFDAAWSTLFQRFENTMIHGNFPGGFKDDYGMVITDATAGKKLLRMVRRMAVFNFVPNDPRFGGGSRNIPIIRLIEDPYRKDSADTLPIQMADVVAYFLHQRFRPNTYVQKEHAQFYFDRLGAVLNRHARRSNALGIVML
jgi:hypothetical protein